MKSSKDVGGWRPVLGVAVVGAMALGVSALAGPRGADQAVRGTGKGGTEVTRLVTGDPTQFDTVVAGVGATTVIAINPVNPPSGKCSGGACTSGSGIGNACANDAACPSMPAYPAGVAINANELTIDRTAAQGGKAGFRAWFNVQLSNWDPNNDGPPIGSYQVKINCSSYYHSDCKDVNPDTGLDGLDLIPASVACPGADATPCQAAYGEGWAPCGVNAPYIDICEPGYNDTSGVGTRPDSWCAPSGGACNTGGVAVGTCNFNFFAVSQAGPNGHPDQDGTCVGGARNGQGCNVASAGANCGGAALCTGPKLPNYYAGTLVLDLPAGAKGKYIVFLNGPETFVATPGPPPENLDSLVESGFVINYVTGSCCHNLGNPLLAGCYDSGPRACVGGINAGFPCLGDFDCPNGSCEYAQDCLNRSDCEKPENAPFVFNPGGRCEDKPNATGCSECTGNNPLTDLTCDDQDACTTETCVILPGPPPVGVCQRGFKAGFNPVKGDPLTDTGNCCDKASGALTDKDDGDVCTADSCSSPLDNRGSAVHDPAGAINVPCDDGNACAFGDKCNGLASDANGGCVGTGVVGQPCLVTPDCTHGGQTPTAICNGGLCDCSVTPKLTYVLNTATEKLCVGGDNDGDPCAKPEDCPRGYCDIFPANCFYEGQKISAVVNIGSAAEPINGGEFLIEYDPSCVTLNSIACLPPYTTTVYGPVATASTVFIACGVDPFGGLNGPLGNVNILALNFTMIGQCNNCELCFGDNNPQHTYLVDAGGYKVPVITQCKEISENGDLVLTVPDNIAVNSECDIPAANVTWDSPSASFSCGDANLICRGAHENGLVLSQAVVNGGGLLPQGASSFCCYAWAKDKCEQTAGCQGDTNNCPSTGTKPNGNVGREGCWTVDISDQTSMDIHVQLEPPMRFDEQTRCIEFCLYGNCAELPYCFQEDVLFGGLYNYIGKANGKIKVPKGKWGCITAQDQLHSLRSCDIPDCIDGQLVARFKGDPTYGGNWLIMGNLDAWKKANPDEDPSLDVIDILDFGKFVASYGVCYSYPAPGWPYCHDGPNGDIDGDGCTGLSDYAYIVRNFLVSSKDCCCGPAAADLPPALAEVTIEELRQMGQADLIVADLNGDGVLNADDMDAFTQGARPVKSNDRKGGKGLRSGR